MTGAQVDAGAIDSGSAFPPCSPRSVTLFDGGAQTFSSCDVIAVWCDAIPDSGVCPSPPGTPPSVGPFARTETESGCCFVSLAYGRPLRNEDGVAIASLAPRSDWS